VKDFSPGVTTVQDMIDLPAFVSTGWSGHTEVLANPYRRINES
jgi:hypothetical protein